MAGEARDVDSTVYAVGSSDGAFEAHEPESFWPKLLGGEIAPDALVTFIRMTGDFPHWEMHPKGDELFVLHSGAIEIDLDDGKSTRTVRLVARQSFVIPRGSWHFARTVEPGDLTVITFGEGTEHRPA
ncbi:MAG: cupin domain-containing protein [Minwuia sp.]|uniref:cupin domain-containing protein n=1 Tax=Minwuia sp. TaxID=2493630 RepID=UPI003A8727DF